jgi:hypothetical protein
LSPCPVCFQQVQILDQHHGTLLTCPHCQAVFFVGWDGQPESAAAAEPSAPAEAIAAAEPSAAPEPVVESAFGSEPSDVAEPALNNFSDVLDFANSTQSQGLLVYDLAISGIDLRAHESALRDCLSDSKFKFEVEDLMSQVQDGKLNIKNLSAAKMMILVQRLKVHPFKITWRQNALTA